MKAFLLGLTLLGLVSPAFALDKAELDKRLQTLAMKLDEMQQVPDKMVPPDAIKKAKGVILLNRSKGGLVFGYQHGQGVAMVKNKSGAWSAPSFMAANEGSFGVQMGGEQSFFVILLMTTNALNTLTDSHVNFAGEARGTAGESSGGGEGKMSDEPPVLVYSSRTGFYGGAAVKGGSVSENADANRIYYDQAILPKDILYGNKLKVTQPATDLAKKLTDYSKAPKKE